MAHEREWEVEGGSAILGIDHHGRPAFRHLELASLDRSFVRIGMDGALKNGRTIIRPLDTFKAGIQERWAKGRPNHANRSFTFKDSN